MSFYITGDLHRNFERFKYYELTCEDSLIALGDVGFNYCLNESDIQYKRSFHKKYDFTIYCVRGNHEARPQFLKEIALLYDEKVGGEVYIEPEFPRIRYFKDYGIYNIEGMNTLVIGGAYSVDKFYRLGGKPEDTDEWTGWFKDEQLSEIERAECLALINGNKKKFDLVLTHTCPRSIVPTDLFLPIINQKTVDKTMEDFLEQVRHIINYKNNGLHYIWLFGHYHEDRLERPYTEQYYMATEELAQIVKRWQNFSDETKEFEKESESFLVPVKVSPKFYY